MADVARGSLLISFPLASPLTNTLCSLLCMTLTRAYVCDTRTDDDANNTRVVISTVVARRRMVTGQVLATFENAWKGKRAKRGGCPKGLEFANFTILLPLNVYSGFLIKTRRTESHHSVPVSLS